MNHLILLRHLLCCVILVGFGHRSLRAQDYQPLHSTSRHCFYQTTPLPKIAYDHNMWGTLMDSTVAGINGDTMYFNYPIFRDTALWRDPNVHFEHRCGWKNAPNWNAGNVLISSALGTTYFFRETDTLVLRHGGEIGEQWPMYRYADSTQLVAQVVSVDLTDDHWVVDSVKTVVLHRRNTAGNLVDDPMNGQTLSLYKHNGIRSAFDLYYFPFDTVSIQRVDPNVINVNSRYLNRPVPAVGDILTRCSEENTTTIVDYSISCESTVVTSVTQIDFQTYQVNAMRHEYNMNLSYHDTVGYISDTSYTSMPVQYVYSLYLDTVLPFICWHGAMPMQDGVMYEYLERYDGWTCPVPILKTTNLCYSLYAGYSEEMQCEMAWPMFECFDVITNQTGVYLGEVDWLYEASYGDGVYREYSRKTVYISNANVTCGNYAVVGLEEEKEMPTHSVVISPNPTSGAVWLTIDANGALAEGFTANVFAPTGQLIRKDVQLNAPATPLDLTGSPNGVYLIVVNDGRSISSHRVVKQ